MSELIDAVEHLDWEAFQEPEDGRLYVHFNGELIRLSYRIGLHMRKPMEVVMGRGDFLKLRAAPQFADYELERLDPENVDKCLYMVRDTSVWAASALASPNGRKLWHPKFPKPDADLTALQLLKQAQWLAQQQQAAQAQLLQSQNQNALHNQQWTSSNNLAGPLHAGGLAGMGTVSPFTKHADFLGVTDYKSFLNQYGGNSGV